MSQGERSLLFYVLDALRSRPDKASDVLRLVENEGSSPQFKQHIHTLQKAIGSTETVLQAVSSVRAEIL
jgi:hypothetical protein